MLTALRDGWQLAAGFNPLVSIVGSAVAAVILTRGRGRGSILAAVAVLVGAWVLGDGLAVLVQASAAYPMGGEATGTSSGTTVGATIGLWALGGFAFGYALPAWAGAYVGRRVTWGTGWASAAVVAATVSGLATAIAAGVGS